MSTVESTKVLDKIRTRGYWSVVIRPATFDDSRVSYTELFPIIERNSVRLRGRAYPHVDRRIEPMEGPDWIGQEYDHNCFIEVWRFHQNGLFVHHFGFMNDWRDQSDFWPADADWQPNRDVYYVDNIYLFVEIFEFAARLAQSQAGGSQMRVEIAIRNLQGRKLVSEGRHIRPSDNYRIKIPEWKKTWDVSQIELIAKPREFAAQAAHEFLARFGVDGRLDILRQEQEKIGR